MLTALIRRASGSALSQGATSGDERRRSRRDRKQQRRSRCGSVRNAGIKYPTSRHSPAQMSKEIIFFIIATPMAIQPIAMPAIIRPCVVIHSSDTYLGDET